MTDLALFVDVQARALCNPLLGHALKHIIVISISVIIIISIIIMMIIIIIVVVVCRGGRPLLT